MMTAKVIAMIEFHIAGMDAWTCLDRSVFIERLRRFQID